MRFAGRMVRVLSLVAALASGILLDLHAQASNRTNPTRTASVFTPLPGLAGTYLVRLTSEWNRPEIMAPCPVQGGETVEGTLAWTGTIYEGMLRRATRYRECAVHGRVCVVTVEGGAEVHAAGTVEATDDGWVLLLRWTPARDVHVEVGGDCPAAYRDGLERLYRSTTQSVAFELPPPNGFKELALDPWPWAVRVE